MNTVTFFPWKNIWPFYATLYSKLSDQTHAVGYSTPRSLDESNTVLMAAFAILGNVCTLIVGIETGCVSRHY